MSEEVKAIQNLISTELIDAGYSDAAEYVMSDWIYLLIAGEIND